MRMTNYAIVNLILFGIVFLEVLFLIVLCCLNEQTIKNSFFWFLLYALLWTVLRVAQSLPEVAENAKLSLCVLYLIYPCVIYSFLLPSYHYIYSLYETRCKNTRLLSWIWRVFVAFEFVCYINCAAFAWTRYADSIYLHVIEAVCMILAFLVSLMQLGLSASRRFSISENRTVGTFICEIALNILVVFHFLFILFSIFHVVRISFVPNNLDAILFFICLELLPLQLLILLVFNFNFREIAHLGNIQVPKDLVDSCVRENILKSNPTIDGPFNTQDVQYMLTLTTRSHKDSEDGVYHMDESRHYLSVSEHFSSVDRPVSPSESVGFPLAG
ncbi:uncharacterized protein [Blastocystis hominis]|uniref:Uncharacterized protein n=1 Tax=Blastocystis hominis TaxID=12968 RepID=D8LWZ1_BLAHO|nr:uncharacterized protein [Blastocystis hominis]CBK20786.2 unnamed protein product [Blastocystis hominis]|eukprot:XP_012894834.1 uncharacterized protein [Blastocystis hominis]